MTGVLMLWRWKQEIEDPEGHADITEANIVGKALWLQEWAAKHMHKRQTDRIYWTEQSRDGVPFKMGCPSYLSPTWRTLQRAWMRGPVVARFKVAPISAPLW
jgi:hypothetical protein